MKLTLEVAGRRLALDLSLGTVADSDPPGFEPSPQGSTCGDLDKAPAWDHDHRPSIGFRSAPCH